jgi:hypothetical protein
MADGRAYHFAIVKHIEDAAGTASETTHAGRLEGGASGFSGAVRISGLTPRSVPGSTSRPSISAAIS